MYLLELDPRYGIGARVGIHACLFKKLV